MTSCAAITVFSYAMADEVTPPAEVSSGAKVQLESPGPDSSRNNPSQVDLRFTGMWPTLPQPWYLGLPGDVETGPDGNVYIADPFNGRIYKFTPDGQYIKSWEPWPEIQFEESFPVGLEIDSDGNVYASDMDFNQIRKFDANGALLTEWGQTGTGPGQFRAPVGIAISPRGQIYVCDSGNARIQIFEQDGTFVDSFKSTSTWITDLAFGPDGKLYVTDSFAERVQVYSQRVLVNSIDPTNGSTIPGEVEQANGMEIAGPTGIAFDDIGNILVAHSELQWLIKLTSDGEFLEAQNIPTIDLSGLTDRYFPQPFGVSRPIGGRIFVGHQGVATVADNTPLTYLTNWQSGGTSEDRMIFPIQIEVDSQGYIWTLDAVLRRVQKTTMDGDVVATAYPGLQSVPGGFASAPVFDIALDSDDNVYLGTFKVDPEIASFFPVILKYSSQMELLHTWTTTPNVPFNLAVDSSAFVYLFDAYLGQVSKYTSDGELMSVYPFPESFPESSWVYADFDSDGNVYAAIPLLSRIVKLDADFVPLSVFDNVTLPQIDFGHVRDLEVVSLGGSQALALTEQISNRLSFITLDGLLIDSFGEEGIGPAQFSFPAGLGYDGAGKLIIGEVGATRIQTFDILPPLEDSRAIVIAAGGPYAGNDLWDATQVSANFAVRTLKQKGFVKDQIRYLSSDLDLDLDSNGIADDVAGDVTSATLSEAIQEWATQPGTVNVLVYLVNHGGAGSFRLNEFEVMDAATLDDWLDVLEDTIPGTLTVVYDACESGSFADVLDSTSNRRIVVTSTSKGESAYFLSGGTVSFSNFFWTEVLNGQSIEAAYHVAELGIQQVVGDQTPIIVDPGELGATTYLGSSANTINAPPSIGAVTSPQRVTEGADVSLWADPVTDDDGVARVWATIRPPQFVAPDPTNTVLDLPTVDLLPDGSGRYEVAGLELTTPGLHQIMIYARDGLGQVAAPKLTSVAVDSPLRRRAIILVGADPSDAQWPAFRNAAFRAYSALSAQGYSEENIEFRSPVTFSVGVDGQPSASNLEYLLTQWAAEDTFDLTLYLVGRGQPGAFQIGFSESLDAGTLDGWLDGLQSAPNGVPGVVTVIYDAANSSSFIQALAPPQDKRRIVIASAGDFEPARFLSNGDISFSSYFWNRVQNGGNVRNAFKNGQIAMKFFGGGQRASWDDTGDGIPDEKDEGGLAITHHIGMGVLLAADDPVIGSIRPPTQIASGTARMIWVADVTTTTKGIDSVSATIDPPGDGPLVEVALADAGGGRYEATYAGFALHGTYIVTAAAIDADGNVSAPKVTTIEQLAGIAVGDDFEPDNSFSAGTAVSPANPVLHDHTFHVDDDQDWYSFTAEEFEKITIETKNLGIHADTYIQLYESDGISLIVSDDDSNPSDFDTRGELFIFQPSTYGLPTGTYYLRIATSPDAEIAPTYGPNATYTVRIVKEVGGCTSAEVFVQVTDSYGNPLSGAIVELAGADVSLESPIAASNGIYSFNEGIFNGSYSVNVSKDGYEDGSSGPFDVECNRSYQRPVELIPTEAATSPSLRVTPFSADFGVVPAGSSADIAFQVTNVGAGTLTGSVTGATPPFSILSGYYSLPAGQSGTVTVRFSPSGAKLNESDSVHFSGAGGAARTLSGRTTLNSAVKESQALALQDLLADTRWNDSLLTWAEASAMLPTLSFDMFNALDQNGDGLVSLVELLEVTVGPVGAVLNVYVNKANAGTELGSAANPFDTVREGAAFIKPGGTLHVVPAAPSYAEKVTIPAKMTIIREGTSGTVRIGAASARPAGEGERTRDADPEPEQSAEQSNQSLWRKLWNALTGVVDSPQSSPLPSGAALLDDPAFDTSGALVYELVMPYEIAGEGEAPAEASSDFLRVVRGDQPVAIRLMSDEPIDTASLWAEVPAEAKDHVIVDWLTHEPEDDAQFHDVWVRVTPDSAWSDLILAIDGASPSLQVTAGNSIFMSEAFVFALAPGDHNIVIGAQPFDSAPQPLENAIGPAYRIEPAEVFDEPISVSIPLPGGIDVDQLQLMAYHNSGEAPGWYPAVQIAGFIAAVHTVKDVDGSSALEVRVNHGGIVALREVATAP